MKLEFYPHIFEKYPLHFVGIPSSLAGGGIGPEQWRNARMRSHFKESPITRNYFEPAESFEHFRVSLCPTIIPWTILIIFSLLRLFRSIFLFAKQLPMADL
jgi:hypothetical protein